MILIIRIVYATILDLYQITDDMVLAKESHKANTKKKVNQGFGESSQKSVIKDKTNNSEETIIEQLKGEKNKKASEKHDQKWDKNNEKE